ncbi:farnesyl pyrophosphate synthetase [Histomonas meleagridis]|uniref:farnesyl pyrophosphate synthetase n=1 Tax=Histomonas meleagridis TaxID=135588 RepID=UPI00355ABC25|nr:farnesyl pyrophosphate synthetase [Histomonas meleagridis]
MKGAVPHPERTNKKCPNTPQKKCPSINVKNSKRSMSATNSPISKKYSLSPENKKSLDLFVSLMINSSNSIDRLYSFCEHHFREELVQIVTKKLDEYITDFKNLLVQIQTQKIVTSQLEADQRPNSVSFSISNWRNYSDENWPDTTSDDWIKVAVSHFTKTAPELPTSPKKQTQTWEERIANAEIKRKRIENIKNREIRMKTNKIRRVNERMNLQQEEAKSTINEKLDTALQRREAILNQIVEKAHNEIEKIQENNFMQRLENEGKKLQLERNMDKATKRHQEMVQDIRNKAKERTASKNQISPDMSPPKKKPKAVTLTEAINQKFLPEEIFPLKGISYEDIPIITIPTFNEEEPKKSQILEKLSKAMINEEQNQSQHIINYLKAINDQKSFIKWESPEAKVIYESLQLILVSNHSNGSQILLKASLNTMQKTQIAKRGLKKIAVVFCKEYLIVALVQNQLYILPESKFHEPFYPTSITNVDDFCACGDENSLRVISGKNFIQYSIQNFKDFLQVSTRELKQSVSQIVSSNVEILFKMKGKNQPQILDMREAKFYDTGKESPRFIGVATGPTGSKTNRLSQRQKVSQFYLVYKDYVEFLRNGPFQRLQAKNNETIIDFKINYPYAIFIFKHFIEVKALVCDNLTLEIPFEPPASKSILCPLPNHSFLYSNDKQLFSVQFVSPTAQIDELTNRKLWENAIALSAAFPDDKTSQSKLNDLYLSYGESLLVQGKFHEAFVNFKNSNKPPSSIVSNFSVLLPYEVTDEKSNLTEWKKKSNTNFSSSMQLDENALVELKNYIKGILEKGCDEETTLMILQSVLFKCYVYVEPNYVIEFIRQKPSIFFDSTEKFLQQKNSDEIFLELCRTYGRNSIAIKFLKDKGLVEELVKYVRMSHDFEKHGKEVFRFVHDKDPKLSPLLFCSNYLDESQVYNILRFIETSAGLKKSEQNIINIKFLDFCIYERKINKNTLNVKLIELYIEILSPSISQHLSALTMNYISIEREPEPIKSYRKGLQKILETCERSDAAAQVDKISDCFLEEKLVAMRRSGMIKNCLQLVSQSIVDFSIALDFCEKVYEEEQNQKDVLHNYLWN